MESIVVSISYSNKFVRCFRKRVQRVYRPLVSFRSSYIPPPYYSEARTIPLKARKWYELRNGMGNKN